MNAREQGLFERFAATFPPRRLVVGSRDVADAAGLAAVDAALAAGDVVFVIGGPGEALLPERFSERAYVSRVHLSPSEVLAWAGGELVGEATRPSEVRQVLALEPRGEAQRATHLPDDLGNDVFSVAAYAELLERSRARGYRFVTFDEALALAPDDDGRYVLLRHDVDFSPTLSRTLAEVEAAAGVASTWFFLLSGVFYNLLAPEQRRVVHRVRDLGHAIGFHYDEHDDVEEGLEILSTVVGRRLHLVAQHNPTLLPRRPFTRADVIDAYDPRLLERFRYVSDSGMRWRGESLLDLIERGEPRIYALCHPESWLTDGRDMIGVIRAVEAQNVTRDRRRYDEFVAGTIAYLRARKAKEGR